MVITQRYGYGQGPVDSRSWDAALKNSPLRLVPAGSLAFVVRSNVLRRRFPVALVPFPVTLNQDMRAVVPHEGILIEYLAQVCRARAASILAKAGRTDGSMAAIRSAEFLSYRIPVPPLDIQRELVGILTEYAALEAELEKALEAELEARRRQYVHYREALLSKVSAHAPHVTLGEVARVVRGASPRPIQVFIAKGEDGVPWIKIGDTESNGKYITHTAERVTEAGAAKSRRILPGDFVLSNSMSFGRPYISAIEGCIHDGWLAINGFASSFNPDFLYHLLRSEIVQGEFARRAGGGTVQNLNADIVRSIVVPVPPLAEQERVVAILDKFDALVNDLSVGLPAELGARRKQYEHYRDRLLTFPEAS